MTRFENSLEEPLALISPETTSAISLFRAYSSAVRAGDS
jgi:hypothetical protein